MAEHARKLCTWFPISQDEEGVDQVWACATSFFCINTETRKPYKYVAPEPIVDEPTGGLWDAKIRPAEERGVHDDVSTRHPG